MFQNRKGEPENFSTPRNEQVPLPVEASFKVIEQAPAYVRMATPKVIVTDPNCAIKVLVNPEDPN
jgi:hypothetical protein